MALTPEQFVEQLAAHQREVFRYIVTLVPNGPDADDIFQETTTAMFRERDRFEPGTSFVGWGCAIARNRVLAHLKTAARDRRMFSGDLIDLVSDERRAMADELADRRRALDHCLRYLSPEQRDLLNHRYARAGTIQQLAERTNRPAKSLYKSLERIRAGLTECISRRLEGGDA